MMTDDDLDRALLALPLAEPPAGLRASILSSTVYAPRPMMRAWEIVALGVALALLAWLTVGLFTSGGPAVAFAGQFARAIVPALANQQTIFWLTCGAGIAALATLFDPRATTSRRS